MGGDDSLKNDVRLDQVYVELETETYIASLRNRPEYDHFKDMELWHDYGLIRLTALEAATTEKFLVLLGDPGSGKSTFVKQLLARIVSISLGLRELPTGWEKKLFPVFTELRALSTKLFKKPLEKLQAPERKKELIKTLHDQWYADMEVMRAPDCVAVLDRALVDGEVLLVFDGLDEVPTDNRELIGETLSALVENYPEIEHIIVTCRVRSYVGRTVINRFNSHILSSFDINKDRKFY